MTLSQRLEQRLARIAIIGQGYVGLPLAVEFARAGFTVAGIDTDPDRIGALAGGQSHTPDVNSEDIQTLQAAGRYRPTSDFAVLEDRDVVIVCVPTPCANRRIRTFPASWPPSKRWRPASARLS